MDSSGAAYIFSADGNTIKKPPKNFFAEETEQFVLFLAVLPILLILIPLFVFSGAMYLSSVHKTGSGPSDMAAPGGAPHAAFSATMSPLEEYAYMHDSSSSGSSDAMDTSLDPSTASVTDTTPFSLSASRHGLITRSVQQVQHRMLSEDATFGHQKDEVSEGVERTCGVLRLRSNNVQLIVLWFFAM